MTEVSFAFLREGPSDDGLVNVIRQAVISAGASSAIGESRPYGGTVEAKLRALLDEGKVPDIVFVHRDSDDADGAPRYDEISRACENLGIPPPEVVGVVPLRMTEAWLLTDEAELRSVVGNPDGRESLGLPKLSEIERRADPKRILQEALVVACGFKGRRLARFKQDIPVVRGTLLQRLDVTGRVKDLSSFQQLLRDTETAVSRCLDSSSDT